ncbi:hypothetical protein C0995_005283 [Termitomyces sp. Mi166|nr:hypothetical protein C0995_005283 [Termitomyces sp. Mi166\
MNSFILFRTHFLRQKPTPVTINPNGDKLGKIIGKCWRALPPSGRKFWEDAAKEVQAEHKLLYPGYRFCPVHKAKPKQKKKKKSTKNPQDDEQCEETTQQLLKEKKDHELTATAHKLNLMCPPMLSAAPIFHHSRPSSAPLPNDNTSDATSEIAVPNILYVQGSPPTLPIVPISRQQQRKMLGNRRVSSALPSLEALGHQPCIEPTAQPRRDYSPLYTNTTTSPSPCLPDFDPLFWFDPQLCPESNSSTSYSGTPPSDLILPLPATVPVVQAPQPQSAAGIVTPFEDLDFWKEYDSELLTTVSIQHQQFTIDGWLGLDFDLPQQQIEFFSADAACGRQDQNLDTFFHSGIFDESFCAPAGNYHTDAAYVV